MIPEQDMIGARITALRNLVTAIIAQEARHLADTADYDQIAMTDEEDEFIRAELRRQANAIAARGVP